MSDDFVSYYFFNYRWESRFSTQLSEAVFKGAELDGFVEVRFGDDL